MGQGLTARRAGRVCSKSLWRNDLQHAPPANIVPNYCKRIILFGIKLYLKICLLFSGQFKRSLYNVDIENRTKGKKKMKKELVSKWLVKGHKVVTVESKRLSDMIDQRMKEMLAEQDRRCGKK